MIVLAVNADSFVKKRNKKENNCWKLIILGESVVKSLREDLCVLTIVGKYSTIIIDKH